MKNRRSQWARAWKDAGRNLRHPHPLVVEAATEEVDADRWRERMEAWLDFRATQVAARGLLAMIVAERRAFPAFVFSSDGRCRQMS